MESETKTNLLRAFAGECQARMRYEIAAKIAGKNDLAIIQDMLYFTANQEKEHAIIFYNYLKDVFKDEDVSMHANYPVDLGQDLASLLEDASKHEYDEATTIYKQFGNEAKEEGYIDIATSFFMISEIEQYHHERFKKYHSLLTSNKLFKESNNVKWMCLNCGFIYEGNEAINVCPVCKHSNGYSLRLNETQFHV